MKSLKEIGIGKNVQFTIYGPLFLLNYNAVAKNCLPLPQKE